MTDILEQLRLLESGARWMCAETADTLEDAVDEIERLRAALRSIANNTGCVEACPCWAKLRGKAERALKEGGL